MSNVWLKSGVVRHLLPENTTGNITGPWTFKDSPHTSIQASVTGIGAIAASVNIEVSNDGVRPISTLAGTITLSGTTSVSDGFITQNAPWKFFRAVVSGASGTINNISVTAGV